MIRQIAHFVWKNMIWIHYPYNYYIIRNWKLLFFSTSDIWKSLNIQNLYLLLPIPGNNKQNSRQFTRLRMIVKLVRNFGHKPCIFCFTPGQCTVFQTRTSCAETKRWRYYKRRVCLFVWIYRHRPIPCDKWKSAKSEFHLMLRVSLSTPSSHKKRSRNTSLAQARLSEGLKVNLNSQLC